MADVAAQMLVKYTMALHKDPLKTKMYTSGVLGALAEILAGKFTGLTTSEQQVKKSDNQLIKILKTILLITGINKKAIQMFIYGSLISAPLGHIMTGYLQKAFAGKTTAKDRIAQIITANLTTAVISNSVYLICMAYINGARSIDRIIAAWKQSIGFLMRVTWITSPISIGVAQKFLPQQLWEPYFAFVRFILATIFNSMTKKKQLAMIKRQELQDQKKKSNNNTATTKK